MSLVISEGCGKSSPLRHKIFIIILDLIFTVVTVVCVLLINLLLMVLLLVACIGLGVPAEPRVIVLAASRNRCQGTASHVMAQIMGAAGQLPQGKTAEDGVRDI